eukprot:COSAG06_NODE_64986_length_258_cov_0.641509_1_plen_48_part_01
MGGGQKSDRRHARGSASADRHVHARSAATQLMRLAPVCCYEYTSYTYY